MSNDKTMTVTEPTTDLTPRDIEIIQAYVDEGMPDIGKIGPSDIARMMELYLSGRTYRQIAMTMQKKKTVILFLGNKFNWFELRQEYLNDLESTVRAKVIESKLVSQDFLLQMTHMWQKKIGNKMNKYFQTGDESAVEDIDLKEIDKYLKTIEILHKLDQAPRGQNPMIGLNAGDGVVIRKTSANEMEITPKQKTVTNLLKDYEEFTKEQEIKNNSDITKKDSKQ